MHKLSTTFVLGYHGCDMRVGERLLNNEPFTPSENGYDWLGTGVYFWEANPARALQFAHEAEARRKGTDKAFKAPFVIGAIIDPGYCLDLISSTGVEAVAAVHASFVDMCKKAGTPLPTNRGGEDMLLRHLDCAVVNHLHEFRVKSEMAPFDTVRGVFVEGDPIYAGAGFREKTHVQIAVRNRACIKGVFRVPPEHITP